MSDYQILGSTSDDAYVVVRGSSTMLVLFEEYFYALEDYDSLEALYAAIGDFPLSRTVRFLIDGYYRIFH